jgi:hypothetical protein
MFAKYSLQTLLFGKVHAYMANFTLFGKVPASAALVVAVTRPAKKLKHTHHPVRPVSAAVLFLVVVVV